MLSRIIYGSRISLMVGVATVLFAGLVGCTLGAVAGYFGSAATRSSARFRKSFSLSISADRHRDHGVSRPRGR
jgi:ABC-type dipeptide/oligopeptide/nickel transport system permease subunit